MSAKSPQLTIVPSLCRMCNDHCGIKVFLDNGRVVDIEGLENHPWNRGRMCIKGRMGVDQANAPDRLRTPLKRVNGAWKTIEMQTALDEIAERVTLLQERYGKRTLGIWKGEAVGFLTQEGLARRFVHAAGSPNYFSNDSQCFVGRWIGFVLVQGIWGFPEFAQSRCVMLWGANPPHSHPNMTQDIMQGREDGGTLIVVDSRLSAIARQADMFLQIRPGTDGSLALGIARELIKNGHVDRNFIDNYSVGFEEYAEYTKAFTPRRVADDTGLKPSDVVEIAEHIGRAMPQVIHWVGNGLEHHVNGINNVRAVACLEGIQGSIDVEGGNYYCERPPLKELNIYDEYSLRDLGPIGADRYPVLYELRHECHTMTAMDTMLTDEPYPLKAMILTGANPALTNPNEAKVLEALKSLDLFVVRDIFMSETAELADYVIPAASYLEHSELHVHEMQQILGLSPKVLNTPGKHEDYYFWQGLAQRLGFGHYFPWQSVDELNDWMLADTGITREQLLDHPEGIHYKPKRYFKYKETGFNTPSGKFEFVSEYLRSYGYEYLPEYIAPECYANPDPQYPLVLITGARNVMFYHGRYHNFQTSRTAFPYPDIEIHPDDAAKLGIKSGDLVTVTSKVGSLDIPANVVQRDEILPGVVQITHGWREANVNIITHDDINDPINGFPLMKSVQVKVEKKI